MSEHFPTAWVKVHLRLEPVGQPEPDRLIVLESYPITLNVRRNDWNTADTFDCEIDLEDFPFDPAIIRGATFEGFMADAGGLDPEFWIKQPHDAMRNRHIAIIGVVDNVENTLDDDWRRVKLTGRDYTAYFLDVEMLPGQTSYMDGSRKLNFVEVIEEIIAKHPNAKALTVVADPDVPLVYPADYKSRGDDPETGSRKKREGEVVWEALQEIALEAGCIVYVEFDRVRIRLPHTVFVDQSLDESKFYRWVVGGNVSSVSLRRDMGRQHGITVQVVSYSPDTKKTLRAIAPQDPVKALKARISAAPVLDESKRKTDTAPRVTVTPFVVRNVKDQAQLQAIADSVLELMRHHESEGEVESDDMLDSRDRSVLQIGFGDPVVFDVSESLRSVLALDRTAQIQALIEKGYGRDTARSVADALNAQRVPFYFKQVEHRFSAADGGGYTFHGEFRARRQVGLDLPAVEKVVTIGIGG